MKNLIVHTFIILAATMFFGTSCQKVGGNKTGSEFMPDMAHSIAYEANYYNYYYNNTWGSREDYYEYAKPRLPVKGTIPRISTSDKGIRIPSIGSVPYYYGDTEAERTRATNEMIDNPYKITNKGLTNAKDLYVTMCGICHGDKGDGGGYLVRDDGGKYPVQPANFLLDEFVNATNGRYYHAIMKGKNLMGGYADKLSYEERWQVIHYIRSLQAKELKLTYNQYENTLNSIDIPAGNVNLVQNQLESKHGHEEDAPEEHHNDHGH